MKQTKKKNSCILYKLINKKDNTIYKIKCNNQKAKIQNKIQKII